MSDPVGGVTRRGPIVVAVVLLLVGGGLADRARRAHVARLGPRAAVVVAEPTGAPPGSLFSSWYCALGMSAPGSPASGSVVIANAGGVQLAGRVTVVPAQGEAVGRSIVVPAQGRLVVAFQDVISPPPPPPASALAPASYAAALVELNGGQAAVEHVVSGPYGTSVAPCASSASSAWYFAEGSTARDDTLLLGLFDPFPEDAIVDLSFSTDQGRAAPRDFQGIVVRARGLTVVDVGQHVRRRETVATTVAARTGRIVADRLELRQVAGHPGIAINLGTPSPALRWYFPDGLAGDGTMERYELFNPTGQESQVELALVLEQGEAEPFGLTVPAFGTVGLVTSQEARVPRGVAHGAVVTVTNGGAVVAERVVVAGAPTAHQGLGDVLGGRQAWRHWLFAAGSANGAVDEWIVVHNPSPATATVSVHALAAGELLAVDGLQGLTVAPGRRLAVRLGDHIKRDDLTLRVDASQEVVVERDLYHDGNGLAATIGVALVG